MTRDADVTHAERIGAFVETVHPGVDTRPPSPACPTGHPAPGVAA
jgi:hypothetical protein